MKSLAHDAFGAPRRKASVQMFAAKCWGTWTVSGSKRLVKRSDGETSTDKTAGFHSRPNHKLVLRNANRALTKSARQELKKQLLEDLEAEG